MNVSLLAKKTWVKQTHEALKNRLLKKHIDIPTVHLYVRHDRKVYIYDEKYLKTHNKD